jgi:DNA mismatch repair protein MSH6
MNHSEFDHRTLKIPESFVRELTPAMAQWWQVKSINMDTILFFKVGKFYELFHMDADVGFSELDLIYMKGPKAHSGFPEVLKVIEKKCVAIYICPC